MGKLFTLLPGQYRNSMSVFNPPAIMPNMRPLIMSSQQTLLVTATGFLVQVDQALSTGLDYHYSTTMTTSIPALEDYEKRVNYQSTYIHRDVRAFNWFIHLFKYLIFPQIKQVDDLYERHTTQHNLLSGLRDYFKGIGTMDASSLIYQAQVYPSTPPKTGHTTAFRHEEFAEWIHGALVSDIPIQLLVKVAVVMFKSK